MEWIVVDDGTDPVGDLFKDIEGVKYFEGMGVVEFEPHNSISEKLAYISRLQERNKVIPPMPELKYPREPWSIGGFLGVEVKTTRLK